MISGESAPAGERPIRWLASWSSAERMRRALAMALLGAIVVTISAFAFGRSFMTYGTETDYLGGFIPEATRILAGEPLAMEFHPPLYAFVLAAVWCVVRDWFVTGLLLSVMSGAGLALASYFLFRRIAGMAAAVGAAVALLASPVFIDYSALATSDAFFTFLYIAAFALAVTALQEDRRGLWLACGVGIGLVVLTRTNGIAALLLMAAPLIAVGTRADKTRNVGAVALGFAIPVLVWAGYAALTGSPLTPTLTYGSLAQTYYADDPYRQVGMVREAFQQRFHGVWEVLTYDPLRIARVYLRDLLVLVRRVFYRDVLLSFPMNQVAFAGMVFLLFRRLNRAAFLVLAGFAAHLLLVNMKAFEARYYLFLVPLFGAAAGLLATELRASARTGPARRIAATMVGLLATAGFVQSLLVAYSGLHDDDGLLADLIKRAGGVVRPNAVLLSLRPQPGFYLHAVSESPVQIDDLPQLERFMNGYAKKGPVYVYIGSDEREWWRVAKALEPSSGTPKWLVPVAGSAQWGWRLYEYRPTMLQAQGGAVLAPLRR